MNFFWNFFLRGENLGGNFKNFLKKMRFLTLFGMTACFGGVNRVPSFRFAPFGMTASFGGVNSVASSGVAAACYPFKTPIVPRHSD